MREAGIGSVSTTADAGPRASARLRVTAAQVVDVQYLAHLGGPGRQREAQVIRGERLGRMGQDPIAPRLVDERVVEEEEGIVRGLLRVPHLAADPVVHTVVQV